MTALPLQDVWSGSRLPLVGGWRNLNTSLDAVFYDVGALSWEERTRLSQHLTPEGRIVVVHPRTAKKDIQVLTPKRFVHEQRKHEADLVGTLVVAGVGSSALGTACFARDVANYLGRPVAGIVSGLGLSDVMVEALGGWFVFGYANAARDMTARTLDAVGFKDHVRDQETHDDMRKEFSQQGLDPESFLYGSPDSTALLYLLLKLRRQIKLLVGHSKGNYSIENALEGFHQHLAADHLPIPADLEIVTLGAVIWFGPEYQNLRQFLGQMDSLGILNSRPDVKFISVPGAWHSLNRELPGAMSVSQALQRAGVRGDRGRPDESE